MSGKIDWWRLPPKIWSTLEQVGIRRTALAEAAGLPDAIYLDPDFFVSTYDGFKLWKSVERLAADPIVGLRLLHAADHHGRDPTFLAAYHAASFREALNNMARLKAYYTPVELHFRESAGLFYATRRWKTTHASEPDVSVDYSFAEFVGLGRMGTGHHLSAVRVELARTGPVIPFFEEFYGCRVKYGAAQDLLVLKSSDLDRPFLSSDPHLVEVIASGLQASMRAHKAHRTIVQQVESEVMKRLGTEAVDIESVAKALNVSVRTLQRRIEAEGTSFNRIVGTGKRNHALDLLSSNQLAIKEVGSMVGFKDTASFYRAFYKWEGMTPAAYRGMNDRSKLA